MLKMKPELHNLLAFVRRHTYTDLFLRLSIWQATKVLLLSASVSLSLSTSRSISNLNHLASVLFCPPDLRNKPSRTLITPSGRILTQAQLILVNSLSSQHPIRYK